MTAVLTSQRRVLPGAAIYGAAALMAVFIGVASTSPATIRIGIAATVGVALVALAAGWPVMALRALIVWLVVLGLVRRLVTSVIGAPSLDDPLLLVAATVLATLALVACHRGALQQRTPLTHAVLLLGGALLLSALNPAQGGLRVGGGGVLLVVVPMLAFVAGRAFLSDLVVRRVLWLYALLAVPAAAYGLAQTFAGMPAWDQRWVDEGGYGALNVNGVIRAFSSFSSGSEYAVFLAIGVVCWVTVGNASRAKLLVVPVVVLLSAALWFESSRGIVVLLVFSLGAMLVTRLRLSAGAAVLAGVVAIVGLSLAADRLAQSRFGAEPAGQLSSHQAEGLADPFQDDSTLHGHLDRVVDGVASVTRQPLGQGVGAVTIAASKFGGREAGTEADLGNAPQAAGIVGLGLYVAVVVLGMRTAHARARAGRDVLSLAVFGCLLVTFNHWLTGGQYAVVVLPWLLLGWLDRPAAAPDR